MGAGEGLFFTLDRGRRGLEDGVRCEMADRISHCGGVEVCEGGFVSGGVGGAVGEEVGD